MDKPVFKSEKRKKTIDMIKKYRKSGGTYEEIADYLNGADVETLSGSGKWHTQTVHRILNK